VKWRSHIITLQINRIFEKQTTSSAKLSAQLSPSGDSSTDLQGAPPQLEQAIMNMTYNGQPIEYESNALLPTNWGTLTFDVLTPCLLKEDAVLADELRFRRLVRQMDHAVKTCLTADAHSLPDDPRMRILKRMSASFMFSTEQVARVIDMFESSRYRVEAIVTLFNRIDVSDQLCLKKLFTSPIYLQEPENFTKVFIRLTPEEQATARIRIGVVRALNPLNLDSLYVLNLSIQQQRQLAALLVQISMEEPHAQLKLMSLDGTELNDIPKKWHVDLPNTGVFRCTFEGLVLQTMGTSSLRDHRCNLATKLMGWENMLERKRATLVLQNKQKAEATKISGNIEAEQEKFLLWVSKQEEEKEKAARAASLRSAMAADVSILAAADYAATIKC
jgi:hypothetical protein